MVLRVIQRSFEQRRSGVVFDRTGRIVQAEITSFVGVVLFCALCACSSDQSATATELAVSPVAAAVIGQPCTSADTCDDPNAVCLDEFPNGYCSAPCASDLACPGDHVCVVRAGGVGAVCARSCQVGSDCLGEGQACVVHQVDDGGTTQLSICDLPPSDVGDDGPDAGDVADVPVEHNYGAACFSTADCSAQGDLSPQCLPGFQDGYCSALCEPTDATEVCGPEAVCQPSTIGGICVRRCDADQRVCRPVYGCCDVGDARACLPPDTVDGCVAVGPFGMGVLGDHCDQDDDCGAGPSPICLTDLPGGYCTSYDCQGDAQCGEDGLCAVDFTTLCLRRCDLSGDDCETDQECCELSEGRSACVATGFCDE